VLEVNYNYVVFRLLVILASKETYWSIQIGCLYKMLTRVSLQTIYYSNCSLVFRRCKVTTTSL